MKKVVIDKILEDTELGYDLVSEKFSQTRNRFWGGLEFIKKYNKNCGKTLDFGCGNGRLIEILGGKNIEYVGVDVSQELLNLAEKKYGGKEGFKSIQFLKIDGSAKETGFPKDFFDTVYSIAVFHHLPGDGLRINRAEELYRVTKKGGYIIITVWDLWPASLRQAFASRSKQKNNFKKIWRNWIDKILRKSDLGWNDAWISFTNNKGEVFNRYHHAFTKNDLRRTFRKAGFEIEEVKKVDGNIVLVGRKH